MAKIIYLISVLNNIKILLFVLILAGVIALAGIALCAGEYHISEEEKNKLARYAGRVLITISVSLIVLTMIPSKKEMYAMFLLKDYEPGEVYEMTKEELKEGIDYFFEKLNDGAKNE